MKPHSVKCHHLQYRFLKPWAQAAAARRSRPSSARSSATSTPRPPPSVPAQPPAPLRSASAYGPPAGGGQVAFEGAQQPFQQAQRPSAPTAPREDYLTDSSDGMRAHPDPKPRITRGTSPVDLHFAPCPKFLGTRPRAQWTASRTLSPSHCPRPLPT